LSVVLIISLFVVESYDNSCKSVGVQQQQLVTDLSSLLRLSSFMQMATLALGQHICLVLSDVIVFFSVTLWDPHAVCVLMFCLICNTLFM